MTIPGGIVTAVGLLLLYQSSYDAYASWAYAWALVAPGSVGVSLFTYGLLHRKLDLVDAGLRTAAAGLGLFVGFGLFFENVVHLQQTGSSAGMRAALPVLAVVLGVLIVLLSILPRAGGRRESAERVAALPNLDDPELHHAGRRLHLHRLAGTAADQGPADRRGVADLAGRGVRFGRADDGESLLAVAIRFDYHGRAEHDHAAHSAARRR